MSVQLERTPKNTKARRSDRPSRGNAPPASDKQTKGNRGRGDSEPEDTFNDVDHHLPFYGCALPNAVYALPGNGIASTVALSINRVGATTGDVNLLANVSLSSPGL